MSESEYGIVEVSEAVEGWWWEHFQGEVADSLGIWGSIFELFDNFCDSHPSAANLYIHRQMGKTFNFITLVGEQHFKMNNKYQNITRTN